MNKTAIKNFSIRARNKLIADIRQQAGLLGITEAGIRDPLPQSSATAEFYDIGTGEPYEITGAAIRQRRDLADRIRQKAAASDHAAAFQYIIEETAWTWFNRLTAVRFMEVNGYLPGRVRVLSSESGKIEPDLVTNPFDADLDLSAEEEARILQLKSDNRLDALFQMLFIRQCNALHAYLPALFEETEDYTELLLHLSVVDQDGVIWHLVHDIPEEDFNIEQGGQVEIIGWLYQYYNTEPKDAVFSRPSGTKIRKEDVPAATQLFTPDWIVRYMVENSLGRIWLDGHPDADLQRNWNYYLEEAEQEPEVQAQLAEIRKDHAALSPEDLTCIDPCMGSGHILVYLFEVLMQIYESRGYAQRDAAQLILEKNLYGLDVDERAAQLAYFSVLMKARQYDRRILTRGITPHVHAIPESNTVSRAQLQYFGADLNPLERNNAYNQITGLLDAMQDAKEYGSALQIEAYDWDLLERFVDTADAGDQFSLDSLELDRTQAQLREILRVCRILADRYQVTVTNPPYMGSSSMNAKLSEYVKKQYPDSKSDLFAVFIERCGAFTVKNGYQAMITQHAWMFLSSYEKLRGKLQHRDIVNMAHLGARAFEEIGGEVVQTAAFVMRNADAAGYQGVYCRLIEPTSQDGKEQMFLAGEKRYTAQQENFEKIPGSPVAYWVSRNTYKAFSGPVLSDFCPPKAGLSTGDNERFLRFFWEVDYSYIYFDGTNRDDLKFIRQPVKWIPLAKGGNFRRWYGNNEYVLNFGDDGAELKYWLEHNPHDPKTTSYSRYIRNYNKYLNSGFSFNDVSSEKTSFRYQPNGFIPNARGPFVYSNKLSLLGYLNSNIALYFLNILAPTLSFNVGDVSRLPYLDIVEQDADTVVATNISLSRTDWDMFETSWDFQRHPMLPTAHCPLPTISAAWQQWKSDCETRFQTLKANEEELNRIFIDIYGLQDELTPDVADKDVTVRRFFDTKEDIPESMKNSNYALTKQDAVKSLLSYAVGCMFGRYSLDSEGLACAGVAWDGSRYSTFIPDEDNCIPITDEEYFTDDIVGRCCDWLKAAYGPETLEQNLDFIAEALGTRGSTSREKIRTYFLKDFYADHCKTYQKRPIYWLFDSGKQNGFKVLVYMHRWNADTIGSVNADYLLRIQRVYESEMDRMQDMIDNSGNPREAAAASRRKEKLSKQLKECRAYYEKLSHLALARINIDLDDGVKVNYRKVQTGADGKFYEVLADSKNIMGKK